MIKCWKFKYPTTFLWFYLFHFFYFFDEMACMIKYNIVPWSYSLFFNWWTIYAPDRFRAVSHVTIFKPLKLNISKNRILVTGICIEKLYIYIYIAAAWLEHGDKGMKWYFKLILGFSMSKFIYSNSFPSCDKSWRKGSWLVTEEMQVDISL
jgi:hypothetical protein